MKKRDNEAMIHLILDIAKKNDDIRAVILNGSRASPEAIKDDFQDYDIVYIVNKVEPFVENRPWLESFGELLIMQTPDEMDGLWPKSKDEFAFLMLFTDGNRIDLTLIEMEKFKKRPRDSQSILLLNKDLKLDAFDHPSDKDYLPQKPTEKEFHDCCNEFLWVSPYVAKGIMRQQLTYAKYTEHLLNEQLMKLLIWDAAINTHFQKSMGAYGKYLEKYIEPEIWDKFRNSYVDADYKNIWKGLFLMGEVFNELALKISKYYDYPYNEETYRNVFAYLKKNPILNF